jgi:site-specific DNA-methyltransferase (cytosine-N4-specific)
VAQQENRRWLSFELERPYVAESAFRFLPRTTPPQTVKSMYTNLLNGKELDLIHAQQELLVV